MATPTVPLQHLLQQSLQTHGLLLRGACALAPGDGLAAPLQSLWLVGVAGSAFWPHFRASAEWADGLPDPLDRWSRRIGDALAQQLAQVHALDGARALYPFDGPPWHPFQRWADRCEPTQPSRMMVRIHPEFGLWHAYRFALALPASPLADLPAAPAQASTALASMCATCAAPCLTACPVGAYDGTGFAVAACAGHLHSGQGQACLSQGCLARAACPVGTRYRYKKEHAAFHMAAFARSHRPEDR